MSITVTYFSFGEIKKKSANQLMFFGEKFHLDHRVTVPYAILSAIDESTGEIIQDLLSRVSGKSTTPDQCWPLRCLHIYPALLCLREVAASFRGGNKPRHYHAAMTFAGLHGQGVYSPEELLELLSKAYRCGPAMYPEILAMIPQCQLDDFTEAAWRTTQIEVTDSNVLDDETTEQLKLYHLLPQDKVQPDLFG